MDQQEYVLGFFSFLGRLFGRKSKDRPTPRPSLSPLNARGWSLLVDASNFAYKEGDLKLQHLTEVIRLLYRRFDGASIHLICDANLPYKFGGEDQMRATLRKDFKKLGVEISYGKKADVLLLSQGKSKPKTIVVSNDWFGKGDEIYERLNVARLGVSLKNGDYVLGTQVIVFESADDPQRSSEYPVGRYLKRRK